MPPKKNASERASREGDFGAGWLSDGPLSSAAVLRTEDADLSGFSLHYSAMDDERKAKAYIYTNRRRRLEWFSRGK